MFGFLSKWTSKSGSRGEEKRTAGEASRLPLPVTEKTAKGTGDSSIPPFRPIISAPIPHPSYSLTGFDLPDNARVPGQQDFPYGAGPSGQGSLSWLNSNSSSSLNSSERILSLPWPQPPQVVRLPEHGLYGPVPIQRSNSSPADMMAESSIASSSTSNPDFSRGSPKGHLKLNTNPDFSRSTQSLQLETYRPSGSADNYGATYSGSYPLVKQLSPIPEQDYFSPDSLRKTFLLPLPEGHPDPNTSTPSIATHSIASSMASVSTVIAPSPGGDSFISELTRPSPSYSNSHPFLTRPLNRTMSQTSSRTLESVISSTRPTPPTPATPSIQSITNLPSVPSLNSPNTFPCHSPNAPTLRTGRSMVEAMPTINGSDESTIYPDDPDDPIYQRNSVLESLHAESFVTASESSPSGDESGPLEDSMTSIPLDTTVDMDEEIPQDSRMDETPDISVGMDGEIPQDSRMDETADVSMIRSEISDIEAQEPEELEEAITEAPLPPANESFVSRRLNRDAELGPGPEAVTLRSKRKQVFEQSTPAFWTFWLGFLLPPLWLIGGWHFTRCGEQPSRMTFWEFYFNTKFWNDFMHGKVHCVLCGHGKVVLRRTSWFRQQDGGLEPIDQIALATQQMPPTPQMPQFPVQITEPGKTVVSHKLPRWITEKQSSDDGRARLNDPKRTLRGISFGYPFLPRPIKLRTGSGLYEGSNLPLHLRIMNALSKLNRPLNQLYGIRLREVRGRPESSRRIIDPWIQRCRYAFCWWLILVCIVSCTLSIYLIIVNTRQLR